MPNVTKILLDGAGNPFNTVLWDDGSGNTNAITQFVDNTPITTVPATAAGSALFVVDTTGYRGVSFTLAGINGSGVTPETSNDGTTWSSIATLDTVTSSYTGSAASNGRVYYIPAVAKFVRARVATYGSGTITCVANLRQLNLDPGNVTIQGNPAIQGTQAAGNAAQQAPVRIGGMANNTTPTARGNGQVVDAWYTTYGAAMVAVGDYQSGNYASLQAGSIDGKSVTTTGLPTDSNGRVYDVVNNVWRRRRGMPDGTAVVSDLDGTVVPVATLSAVGILFAVQTSGYAGVSFITSNSWNNSAINFEGSNDSTNGTDGTWASINVQILNNNSNGGTTQTASASTPFFIPAVTTWVRARISSYANTGGTPSISGWAALRSLAPFTTNTSTIGNYKSQFWQEVANGTLAANTTQNYTTRDTGQGSGGTSTHSRFSAYVDPGVASSGATATLQGSWDNSNWTPLRPAVDVSQPIPVVIESRIFFRYNRITMTNGATAQTGLYISTQYGD